MLLAKKRASDRRDWLEDKGNLADLGVDPELTNSCAGSDAATAHS